jgi:hypothetical protein
VLASCTDSFKEADGCSKPAGRTFYVSSSAGKDSNAGTSEGAPLKSLKKASELEVMPGDKVLFKCGDTWQNEVLELTRSGDECAHVIYGSYPANCEDQPRFSGSLPISGWHKDSGSVWVADLNAGENSGKFPKGINQLLKGDARLPLGRWPNIGQDGTDITNGYSHIDRHAGTGSADIEDDQLPDADWTGAVIRYQWIRWQLPNRKVTSSGDKRLTLNQSISCWRDGGGCGKSGEAGAYGWGYVVTSHRATLDQEGEWYYDADANKVYLLSAEEPSGVEGSVIDPSVEDLEKYYTRSVVTLGRNLENPVHHVVIENLRVENGFRHGISTPINLKGDDHANLVIRCNTVRNVDGTGLLLETWVFDAENGRDGWRGGRDVVVANNVVDGANHFGMKSYARSATFQENDIRNIGLAENLNRSGLGCAFDSEECTENGDGMHFPRGGENPDDATHTVLVRRNRLEKTGYCGIDIFGEDFTVEENYIHQPCITKGDCGGIRTFGRNSLEETPLRNVEIRRNVIVDVVGVTYASSSEFSEQFGFGLYLDSHSRDVIADGNTIIGATAYSILYQNSSGRAVNNVMYGNKTREIFAALSDGGTADVQEFTGNVMVGTSDQGSTASVSEGALKGADDNYYFNPYRADGFWFGARYDLAGFKTASGGDANSKSAWYTQKVGEAPKTEVFYNETASTKTVELKKSYVDLDQKPVTGSLELPPFSSKVLVAQ